MLLFVCPQSILWKGHDMPIYDCSNECFRLCNFMQLIFLDFLVDLREQKRREMIKESGKDGR